MAKSSIHYPPLHFFLGVAVCSLPSWARRPLDCTFIYGFLCVSFRLANGGGGFRCATCSSGPPSQSKAVTIDRRPRGGRRR